MEIFQKSVLQKYLTNLDKAQVKQAFTKFKSFYGNQARIENIRLLKEENCQEGFLREIFVQVLGYTINPNENYNLTTEFKNQTDAKKADGAILKDGNAIGVIELKSTQTKNLESIKEQAFSYKNNQPCCRYVITSNFQKLRFYIDNATEYEEFDLFSLSEEQFEIFYLILNKDSILSDKPLKLKEETKFHEENISDKFYKNYSDFKANIYNNLIVNNPQYDKLILFKMSQKLLDRLLFVFFAEDTGLVPPNAISRIVDQWRQLEDLEAYQPLYDRFKQFFTHLNEGKKYKNYELPPYNGGLFAPDEILDNLKIDDEVLNEDSLKLSSFDFNTDVDVNILGHIFEHSLSEIEEITAEIKGEQADRKKSKRKKEGIFYTPKYITQYIVENTVGALCKEKKQHLDIHDIDIAENYRTASGKLSAKGKALYTKLEDYKKWLFTLKILDPACGSGAFLNQALDFLIKEHKTIDDMIADLLNEPLRLFDTDKAILENNLFGVDINEESVEIAKLSLWLHTAKKGRRLSNLSNNIKCGNSLIDDPEVAGDKAFDWGKEFPQIFQTEPMTKKDVQKEIEEEPDYTELIEEHSKLAFEKAEQAAKLSKEALEYSKKVYEFAQKQSAVSEDAELYRTKKGGFDVVIGNPPYVRSEMLGDFKKYLHIHYKAFNPASDLFAYFYEKSFSLLKKGGLFGFISNTFDKTTAGKEIRHFLKNNTKFIKYVDFTSVKIFESATTYPIIFIISNSFEPSNNFVYVKFPKVSETTSIDINCFPHVKTSQSLLKDENWSFLPQLGQEIIVKIRNNPTIRDKYGKTFRGILTGLNKSFIIKGDLTIPDHLKFIYEGKEISKWNTPEPQQKLILFKSKWTKKTYGQQNGENIYLSLLNKDFPELIDKLIPFEEAAKKRYDKGEFWWELRNCAYYDLFEKHKVIFPNLQITNKFCFDDKSVFINAPAVFLPTDDLFLLSILNSKLIWYFLKSICVVRSGGYIEVKPQYFEQIPIPNLLDNQIQILTNFAETAIHRTKSSQFKIRRFLNRVKTEFNFVKITKRLGSFYDYDFKIFVSELKKQKVALSLKQQDEWEDYFNEYKTEINNLQNQISQTDREIDQMVYELYGLTPEEIEIVENAV